MERDWFDGSSKAGIVPDRRAEDRVELDVPTEESEDSSPADVSARPQAEELRRPKGARTRA